LREIAIQDNRTVSTEDLGNEVAAESLKPVFTKPLKRLKIRGSGDSSGT
jgi:hypothetical protein